MSLLYCILSIHLGVFTPCLKVIIGKLFLLCSLCLFLLNLLIEQLLSIGTQSREMVACSCSSSIHRLTVLVVLLGNYTVVEVVICHLSELRLWSASLFQFLLLPKWGVITQKLLLLALHFACRKLCIPSRLDGDLHLLDSISPIFFDRLRNGFFKWLCGCQFFLLFVWCNCDRGFFLLLDRNDDRFAYLGLYRLIKGKKP